MKNRFATKTIVFFVLVILVLHALIVTAAAGTLLEDKETAKKAETFDEQLAILDRMAEEHAAELASGGWDLLLGVSPAPGLPEGLIPEDWEAYGYTEADGFPEELREHKFFVMNGPTLAGSWFCRLPAKMRAASLKEAEYVMDVESVLTPSGYEYIPPATSHHRDYSAYVLNLKTGEAIRFWTHRNYAKRSGKWGELDGDKLTSKEIWEYLDTEIRGEIRYELEDGTQLIFGRRGEGCCLKGCEGNPEVLEVPAVVAGHPVTEIGKASLRGRSALKRVILSEGITKIGEDAFYNCQNLETVLLPEGLQSIEGHAFDGDTALSELVLPGSLSSIGGYAFRSCSRLSRVCIQEGLASLNTDVFRSDYRMSCIYLPASLQDSTGFSSINSRTVIYAPEGSFSLQWAQEHNYRTVICNNPAEMPQTQYLTEGDFEFLLFDGEAALCTYLGKDASVIIPDTAGGVPVTKILNLAFHESKKITCVKVPASIREIRGHAILAWNREPIDIYISNPETMIEEQAFVRSGSDKNPVILHAPEDSTAQQYVKDSTQEYLSFESWDGI